MSLFQILLGNLKQQNPLTAIKSQCTADYHTTATPSKVCVHSTLLLCWTVTSYRPGHEHSIKASSSWVMEKPKEASRAKTKRIMSRGPSEDTPAPPLIQVLQTHIQMLRVGTCILNVYKCLWLGECHCTCNHDKGNHSVNVDTFIYV